MRQIAEHLDVALSSVSVWVRDVPVRHRAPPPPAPPADALPARRLLVWRSGELRRCGRCHSVLPVELFNALAAGRQWWCRGCFARYHAMHRDEARARSRERRRRAQALVVDHLLAHECTDCGESDIVVLEFDHLRDKRGHVAVMAHRGVRPDVLRAEIAKCEVVCVNCHRRRTSRRAGWRRLSGDALDAAHLRSPLVRRNLSYLHSVLRRSCCLDCGESDVCTLDFDHVGDKHATVPRLAVGEYSLARIAREIGRCEVRCANCHRRRTFENAQARAAGSKPSMA